MSTDKYASFYDEAPTFSAALAALEDKECPEKVVADLLSFDILPTDDGTIGDRLTKYYYLLPAGIQKRVLSADALDQILNVHIEMINEDTESALEGMGPFGALETAECFESTFDGLFEQVNLSSETIGKFADTVEKLAKAISDLRDSGSASEEQLDFEHYFENLAPTFEALAAHPNATKSQKDKCLEISELMKSKATEASRDYI
jgi:hypothetical protein